MCQNIINNKINNKRQVQLLYRRHLKKRHKSVNKNALSTSNALKMAFCDILNKLSYQKNLHV